MITLHPNPHSRRIVGGNTPACLRAIDWWTLAFRVRLLAEIEEGR